VMHLVCSPCLYLPEVGCPSIGSRNGGDKWMGDSSSPSFPMYSLPARIRPINNIFRDIYSSTRLASG